LPSLLMLRTINSPDGKVKHQFSRMKSCIDFYTIEEDDCRMDDYINKRLQRIHKVMTLAEMADALDSSPATMMRWLQDSSVITIDKVAAIKRLHVKLRGKIAWRIKKDEARK